MKAQSDEGEACGGLVYPYASLRLAMQQVAEYRSFLNGNY